MASLDWAKTTARGYKKHLSFGIWCDLCQRFYGISRSLCPRKWDITKTHLGNSPSVVKHAHIPAKHTTFNTLRPRQNGRHFADDIFKCTFLNENVSIPVTISLKFVPKGAINNIPALVQIMVWRRSGDKPLSEPMMVNLLTHICVTRPQWVNFIDMNIQVGSYLFDISTAISNDGGIPVLCTLDVYAPVQFMSYQK